MQFNLDLSLGVSAGGDPTVLTPSNADTRFTALGLTQAGTGTTWGETGQAATPLYEVAAAKVPLAVETIAGKKYFGPIVNPASTNLALYSSDGTNAAWVKTNCTASLQIGSMSDAAAANGHTLLTATANNATCLQSITSTSGERVSKFWLARGSGSGAISLTQDNGSTWADVTLTDDPQPFNVAAATLANPVIGIRIATSGDSVRLYGVQHQVAARALRPRIGPTAGSTVTTGGRRLTRTLSVAPTAADFELAVRVPPTKSDQRVVFLGDATDRLFDVYFDAALGIVLFVRTAGVKSVLISKTSPAAGELVKISAVVAAGTNATILNVDDGTPVTATPSQAMPSTTALIMGYFPVPNNYVEEPILAFRDNLGNLLPAPYGWNTSLLDNWS